MVPGWMNFFFKQNVFRVLDSKNSNFSLDKCYNNVEIVCTQSATPLANIVSKHFKLNYLKLNLHHQHQFQAYGPQIAKPLIPTADLRCDL